MSLRACASGAIRKFTRQSSDLFERRLLRRFTSRNDKTIESKTHGRSIQRQDNQAA